jgi:hypothetical protein
MVTGLFFFLDKKSISRAEILGNLIDQAAADRHRLVCGCLITSLPSPITRKYFCVFEVS